LKTEIGEARARLTLAGESLHIALPALATKGRAAPIDLHGWRT